MNPIKLLFKKIVALFDSNPYKSRAGSANPNTYKSQKNIDGDYAEINIHLSKKLLERKGRIPENVLAKQLEYALSQINIDYIITTGLEPVDVPSNRSVCGEDNPIAWWAKEITNKNQAKDSNPLLLYSHGGGCGFIGGNVCTCPGMHISRDIDPVETSAKPIGRNLSACLHEIGHNLLLRHDHDKRTDGKQHTGVGHNDHTEQAWYRTPMNVANDTTNICGTKIKNREYQRTMNMLYYSQCSKEHIELVEK
jgi:hypothetical protein